MEVLHNIHNSKQVNNTPPPEPPLLSWSKKHHWLYLTGEKLNAEKLKALKHVYRKYGRTGNDEFCWNDDDCDDEAVPVEASSNQQGSLSTGVAQPKDAASSTGYGPRLPNMRLPPVPNFPTPGEVAC